MHDVRDEARENDLALAQSGLNFLLRIRRRRAGARGHTRWAALLSVPAQAWHPCAPFCDRCSTPCAAKVGQHAAGSGRARQCRRGRSGSGGRAPARQQVSAGAKPKRTDGRCAASARTRYWKCGAAHRSPSIPARAASAGAQLANAASFRLQAWLARSTCACSWSARTEPCVHAGSCHGCCLRCSA